MSRVWFRLPQPRRGTPAITAFGPLEVDYDFEAARRVVTRASIESGPTRSGATKTCCPWARRRSIWGGLTPLRADRLAEDLGLGELWIKDDTANPTGSFKDRVVSVALTRPASSDSRWPPAPRREPRDLGGGPRGTGPAGRWSVIPSDLEMAKVTMTAIYGGTVVASKALRRRQPAVRRADQPSTRLGVRERQLAHLLRRGLQDTRLRDRRAARMAGPDQVVVPMASGSQLTKVAKGFRRVGEVGLLDERARAVSGAQADGLLAGRHGLRRGHRRHPPGQRPKTIAESLAIGNPADGRYALERCARSGGALRARSPTTRSSRASGCWPGPRGSSPRPPAG